MSIVKVAAKAGVSIATVSRVMNASHLVNAATARRVTDAMRELNYSAAPGSKRRGRKAGPRGHLRYKTVAFLWTGARPSASSITGIEMLQGASAALRGHNVNLLVDHVGAEGRLPAAVASGEVDGLLIHGPEPQQDVVRHLCRLPTVWLLSPGSSEWGDRVRPDHERLGIDALNHLAAAGCRRVACVTYAPKHGIFYALRASGFGHQAAERGIDCTMVGLDVEPQATHSARFRVAALLVEKIAALSPAIDGLFISNELGAYVHEQLGRRGLRPMIDFTMIAGDRDFAPQHLEPPPVLVTVHGMELGRLAVDLLFWRLANPGVPRMTKLLASSLEAPA